MDVMETDRTHPEEISGEAPDPAALLSLFQKSEIAEVYNALKKQPSPVKEIVSQVSPGTTATYDYVKMLLNAGILVEENLDESRSAVYNARDFELTLEVDGNEVRITDELATVVAHRKDSEVIDQFIEQHGYGTLSNFIELTHHHAEGNTTHRSIAEQLGITRGTAFDMLAEVSDILDIDTGTETTSGGDIDADEATEIIEDARQDK